MSDALHAPWTDDQVTALNAYQREGRFHPYTCGNDSRHHVLFASRDGWVCLDCTYTQDWAHRTSMAIGLGGPEV